jgi:hypothetical protein
MGEGEEEERKGTSLRQFSKRSRLKIEPGDPLTASNQGDEFCDRGD